MRSERLTQVCRDYGHNAGLLTETYKAMQFAVQNSERAIQAGYGISGVLDCELARSTLGRSPVRNGCPNYGEQVGCKERRSNSSTPQNCPLQLVRPSTLQFPAHSLHVQACGAFLVGWQSNSNDVTIAIQPILEVTCKTKLKTGDRDPADFNARRSLIPFRSGRWAQCFEFMNMPSGRRSK